MNGPRPRSPYWFWLGVAFCAAILALALMPMSGAPGAPGADKIVHAVAFAGLGGWFGALSTDHRQLTAVGLALLVFGAAIELLQGMVGWRDASLADLAADVAGLVLGFALLRSGTARALRYIEVRVRPAADRA